MGLHGISTDASMISYHCADPECSHHNCAGWEDYMECIHHDQFEHVIVPAAEMRKRLAGAVPETALSQIGDAIISQRKDGGRKTGQTHQIPTDHPDIQFTGENMVALPACTGTHADGTPCTTRMFLKVAFTEAEMKATNITIPVRDKDDPTKITGFTEHPMVARHKALAAKLRATGRDYKAPGQPAPAAGQVAG